MTLYDDLQMLVQMPEWVDRERTLDNIIERWRARVPIFLMPEGKATFEESVRPLVEENLRVRYWNYRRGVCNSAEFDQLGNNTRRVCKDALNIPFEFTRRENFKQEFWMIVVTLTVMFIFMGIFAMGERLTGPPEVAIPGLSPIVLAGAFAASLILFVVCIIRPSVHEQRRRSARFLLERAKFLDKKIGEWRQQRRVETQ